MLTPCSCKQVAVFDSLHLLNQGNHGRVCAGKKVACDLRFLFLDRVSLVNDMCWIIGYTFAEQ